MYAYPTAVRTVDGEALEEAAVLVREFESKIGAVVIVAAAAV